MLGLLGRGGMAAVYRVRHLLLDTEHALKVSLRHHARLEQRLLREGRVQAALRHQNLVAVTDIVEVEGRHGLVLELVDGGSLDELLGDGELPLGVLDELVRGVLAGVAHAHAHGLVHRDLKPENVLLARGPEATVPKVTDFGLVRLLERRDGAPPTAAGAVMGTPLYMAPEQLVDASSADRRADVWSLGAMLYELATGTPPYLQSDLIERRRAALDERHLPVEERRPDLPPRMAAAIRAALLAERAARPGDAAELASIWSGDAARPGRARLDFLGATPPTVDLPPLDQLQEPDDAFVGRERLLGWIPAMLRRGQRLVSLVGPGGSGKTRLALRLARDWPHEALLVQLAGAHDMPSLLDAVGRTLRLDGHATTAAIASALAARPDLLLVLDTGDRLRGVLGPTVGDWLRAAPSLRVLATSSHPLGISGERSCAVEGLPERDAVALFLLRAQQHRPDWHPDEADVGAIRELCGAVDHLCLGIELLAGRAGDGPLEDLAAAIRAEPDAIRHARGDVPARQASLAAMFRWTLAQLDRGPREVLRNLLVFEGSFSPQDAAAVLDMEPAASLDELCQRSLLVELSGGRLVHYRGLRAVLPRIDGPPSREAVARHARHVAWLVDEPKKASEAQARQLQAALPDLSAAARRAEDADTAARAALLAVETLARRAPWDQVEELARRGAARGPRSRALELRLWSWVARALHDMGEVQAMLELVDTLVERAGDDDDALAWAHATVSVGHLVRGAGARARAATDHAVRHARSPAARYMAHTMQGVILAETVARPAAQDAFQSARDVVVQHALFQDEVESLCHLAIVDVEPERMARVLPAAIRLAERADRPGLLAQALNTHARLSWTRRDLDQTISACTEAVRVRDRLGGSMHSQHTLTTIGDGWLLKGDVDRAVAVFEQALARTEAREHTRRAATTLGNLGRALVLRGSVDEGVRWLQQAVAIGGRDEFALQFEAWLEHHTASGPARPKGWKARAYYAERTTYVPRIEVNLLLAEALCDAGDADEARGLLAELDDVTFPLHRAWKERLEAAR